MAEESSLKRPSVNEAPLEVAINRNCKRRIEEIAVEHVIFYQRPENPWSRGRMVVQTTAMARQQIQRLTALQYSILNVVPPLDADCISRQ